MSEIEAVTATGVFQWVRAVDEKYGVITVVFFAKCGKERVSNDGV